MSDLLVDIHNIGGDPYDEYYLVIQSQEKITNLSLTINYKAKSGNIVKTKTIHVGKVVPGNKYTYELDQSGIDWDYLYKTSSFSFTIASGTVEQ